VDGCDGDVRRREWKCYTRWTPRFSCCWASSFWRAVTEVCRSEEVLIWDESRVGKGCMIGCVPTSLYALIVVA